MKQPANNVAIQSISRLILVVAAGFTGLFLLGFATTLPFRLSEPVPLSAVEPQPVVGALRVARGEVLYRDYMDEFPVVPLTYGALEYESIGLIGRVLGIETTTGMLLLGRWVTFLATIGCVALIAVLAHQRSVPWRYAFIAGLPLFWFPYMDEWLVKFTPDTLALLASLGGWALVGPPGKRGSRKDVARLCGAILLWIIVYHVKLIVLIGPVGFAAERLSAALRQRSGKSVLPVAIAGFAVLVGVLLTSLLVNVMTDGMWKLNAVDSTAACRFRFGYVVRSLISFAPASFLGPKAPVIFGGLGVFLVMTVWAILRTARQPLYGVFLALLLVNLLFLAKQGANINYLLGATLAWGLAAVVDVTQRRPFALSVPEMILAGMIVSLIALDMPSAPRITKEISLPSQQEFSRADELRKQIADDKVLVADPVYGITREAAIPWADTYHASLLDATGTGVFDPIFAKVAAGEYDLVITGRFAYYGAVANYHDLPVSPRGLWTALRASYTPIPFEKAPSNWLVFWVPRGAPQESLFAPDGQ
ncbi:hypothetical protein KQI84_00025 [bacterium]|nr:hypothetical protein [bacterium]